MRTKIHDGMRYEKTPVKIIRRKAIAKMTNDITKLSTLEILRRLFKRHETLVLYLALTMTWTMIFIHALG